MTKTWEDGLAALAHLLAPLNVALFTLGSDHVSVAELLGFVTGAASVWLTVLARISNFPVGIANSAFFLNEAAAAGSPLVVCDTDAFATSVWQRRCLGARARGLQPWATTGLPRHDVYLLTSHEGVPWQDDGLREGDLAVRAAMTGWFGQALTAAGHSWVLLTGSTGDRLALAVRVTDEMLRCRARFGPAITDSTQAGEPAGTAVSSLPERHG